MSETHRDRFIKRLSSVGIGLREDIQLALGGIVHNLRDLVVEGGLTDHEVRAVIELHDNVEALWRATLRSNPPLRPAEIVGRLRELRASCTGPLEGIGVQMERVCSKAELLEEQKKHL